MSAGVQVGQAWPVYVVGKQRNLLEQPDLLVSPQAVPGGCMVHGVARGHFVSNSFPCNPVLCNPLCLGCNSFLLYMMAVL